jgi:hypothetical protein
MQMCIQGLKEVVCNRQLMKLRDVCVAGEDLVPEPKKQVQENDEGCSTRCLSAQQ